MKRITKVKELKKIAKDVGLQKNWQRSDQQGIEVILDGKKFDDNGFWGGEFEQNKCKARWESHPETEKYVIIKKNGIRIAEINLATLFAFACGYKGK